MSRQKHKTHQASAKRFKVTSTGRIFHDKACRQHKLAKVRPQYRRQARRPVEVKGGDRKMLRGLLGV